MKKLVLALLIAASPALIEGQSRRKTGTKPVVKPTPTASATPAPEATPQATPSPEKKNGRPANATVETPTKKIYTPVYVYTFDRPGFTWSSIRIEHDDDGRGRIWFKRDGETDALDDPIELSPATVDTLKNAFAALNFLDSTENYQYTLHDYSNMGNLSITLHRGGRSRTAKFNWTDNKFAKVLMDTYRAISTEATWKFEITSARNNQPLLTPGIVDSLDSYLRLNEISDPPHLVPFLTPLSNDERLPLIARNHLTRIIAQITKSKH